MSYNSRDVLPRAIESVLEQTYPDIEFVVIDNGSDDGSRSTIDGYADRIDTVVYNEANRGYAAGMNQGLRLLAACDIVMPLNCDVSLSPDYIQIGVPLFADDDTTAIVSGTLRTPSADNVDAGALALRFDTRVRRLPDTDYQRCFKVNGAAPLVRGSVLAEIAIRESGMYFDEVYDTYREDIDMAARALLLGSSSRLSSELRGTHARSASSAKGLINKPSRLRRNILSGRYRIALRYFPVPVAAASCAILVAQDAFLMLASFVGPGRELRRDVVASWSRVLGEIPLLLRHRRRWGVFDYPTLAHARSGSWSA